MKMFTETLDELIAHIVTKSEEPQRAEQTSTTEESTSVITERVQEDKPVAKEPKPFQYL
jgi:hypothetical protein